MRLRSPLACSVDCISSYSILCLQWALLVECLTTGGRQSGDIFPKIYPAPQRFPSCWAVDSIVRGSSCFGWGSFWATRFHGNSCQWGLEHPSLSLLLAGGIGRASVLAVFSLSPYPARTVVTLPRLSSANPLELHLFPDEFSTHTLSTQGLFCPSLGPGHVTSGAFP